MTIKTIEKDREGLKRSYTMTIPAADIEARVDAEVKKIAPQVRMPGFRPGKVPANLIRKMHGEGLMQDALNNAVQAGVEQLLNQTGIRPAVRPEVSLVEHQPGKDAEVSVEVEALPAVPSPNVADLKLERLTIPVDDKAIDQQLEQIARGAKRWEDAPKKHAASAGDAVVLDFVGKIDGVPFEGGTGQDMTVELGAGRLIPGFEDQLVGAKAGEEREVRVTFPKDYPSESTRGKDAVFEVKVTAVKIAGETKIDDELAKVLGLSDIGQLRDLVKSQFEQQNFELTRTHMKRQLLDQLAARHDFVVPQTMVDAEYENILRQLHHEAQNEEDPNAAMAEIERDSAEYKRIAERRVRLGLLLSEIGALNGVTVSDEEMNNLIANAASQYQGKDRDMFVRYVQQDATAQAQLRAPLYEDKVVDFLFTQAEVTDREASREQVEHDLEAEEGHVHGPDCGHSETKSKSRASASKSTAKGKPASGKASAKAEVPAKGATGKATDKPRTAKPVKEAAGAKPADKAAKAKPAKSEGKTGAKAAPKAKPETKPKTAAKKTPAKKAR